MAHLGLSELTVLLVEPSVAQRRIIGRLLGELGIERILEAGGGRRGLEMLEAGGADLVVSALYLPDMTGTDLLHALKADPRFEATAFLLISSETRFRYLDPVRQAGAVGILPKPFGVEQLKAALDATLDYLDPSGVELADYDPESLEVLIVDDSALARRHIRRVLTDMGLERFTEAADGTQALGLLNDRFFDLVVTDYNMPHMDGRELVDWIRGRSGQAAVPILMVTSEADDNRLAAVQRAGVSAICDKPFEAATVRQLLRQMLGQ